jgi:hypothetical protein
MKKVLLCCEPKHLEFFKGTILRRDDVELSVESDMNSSIRSLLKSPPALYLIHGSYEGPLEVHLQSLSFCYPKLPFPVALMSDVRDRSQLPPFVKKIIPLTADRFFFNDAVAELLNLPTRRSARLAIRIGLNLAPPNATTIANTVNMSATGMLVESFKPLTPGKVYQFRFMGLPKTVEVPPISARIVREEAASMICDSTRNYAIEFVDMPAQTMETFINRILG